MNMKQVANMLRSSLLFQPWGWRRYVPPKGRLTLKEVHCVTSQTTERFLNWISFPHIQSLIPKLYVSFMYTIYCLVARDVVNSRTCRRFVENSCLHLQVEGRIEYGKSSMDIRRGNTGVAAWVRTVSECGGPYEGRLVWPERRGQRMAPSGTVRSREKPGDAQ
jgi:hypothetical protein